MASVQAMRCEKRCGFTTPAVALDSFSAPEAYASGIAMGKMLSRHKRECGGLMEDAWPANPGVRG